MVQEEILDLRSEIFDWWIRLQGKWATKRLGNLAIGILGNMAIRSKAFCLGVP